MFTGFEVLKSKRLVRLRFEIGDVANYIDVPLPVDMPAGCMQIEVKMVVTTAADTSRHECLLQYLYASHTDHDTLISFSLPGGGKKRMEEIVLYRVEQ